MIPHVTILGVKIHAITSENALNILHDRLNKGQKSAIATVNTEFIVESQHNHQFKQQLNSSDLATADGIGVLWAARLAAYQPKSRLGELRNLEIVIKSISLGISTLISKSQRYQVVPEQITGVDFSFRLANFAAEHNLKLFLLGERQGIAAEAGEKIKASVPGVNVAGTFSGNGDKAGDEESISILRQYPAEILFVAYGAPKQELWIQRNLPHIPALIAIGVGGTFMFLSGKTKRAPALIRRFGLEWLYRLITQPWRWKRQLALPRFIYLVVRDKIASSPKKV